MNNKTISFGIACGMLFVALFATGNARAQSSDDAMAAIQFPIEELGGCASKDACKVYCDDSSHIEACVSFAEKNGLMPKEEVEKARKFIAAGGKGPGGCTGKASCEAYCNDTEHIDVCIAYAEENGMMSENELAEAKKVQAAIQRGVKPPACSGKRECDAYCESVDHMPECIAFAKEAGFMSAEEQADAEKMLRAIQSGAKPPACRGKEECDKYCSQEEHFEECVEFGKAAGFMTDEEYEMAKKTGGKGPGGCRGKEECDAFCQAPENEESCFKFAEEHGLISEERQRQMDDDRQKIQSSFANIPAEVSECLAEKLGADVVEKIKSGEMRITRQIGEAMPACFGKFEEQRRGEEGREPQRGEDRFEPRPGGIPGEPPPGGQFEGRPGVDYQAGQGEYPQPPEGSRDYPPPCEGENCQPPSQFMPPTGSIAPVPPERTGEFEAPPPRPAPSPAPTTDGGTAPAPVTDGGSVAPATIMPQAETVAPAAIAPQAEPVAPASIAAPAEPTAPAPAESVPAIAPESLSGAVILFLHSLGL